MKKLYLLLLPFLLAASCGKKDDDQPADKLPPATMTGENTFGCLVNGEVWLPGSDVWLDGAISAMHDQGWVGCDQLYIGVKRFVEEKGINQSMAINIWCPILGENIITPTGSIVKDFNVCGNYRVDTLSPHVMIISRLDSVNYIASGSFFFVAINDDCNDTLRITDGRFDVYSHP